MGKANAPCKQNKGLRKAPVERFADPPVGPRTSRRVGRLWRTSRRDVRGPWLSATVQPDRCVWWSYGLTAAHPYNLVSTTPATITTAATALSAPIFSPKASQPISTANRIDVSRSAATTASGATVIAQTDTA